MVTQIALNKMQNDPLNLHSLTPYGADDLTYFICTQLPTEKSLCKGNHTLMMSLTSCVLSFERMFARKKMKIAELKSPSLFAVFHWMKRANYNRTTSHVTVMSDALRSELRCQGC